jgi:hypothetical protein
VFCGSIDILIFALKLSEGAAKCKYYVDGIPVTAARIAATEAMKYYIYISDAKVDMLFPQVPHDIKKKIATEWKMDLKLLSASRRVETEGEDNRIARLETVVDFIREYGNLGSIDEPGEYIYDEQSAWVGIYTLSDVAYFSGKTEKTIFGLSGTGKHLVGADPNKSPWPNLTSLINIFDWLSEQNPTRDPDGMKMISVLVGVAEHMRRPRQRIEFMAKRLLEQEYSDEVAPQTRLLLATPLYVAMADHRPLAVGGKKRR